MPSEGIETKMGANTTLKRIAEHLNISISTVSRALKDHPDVAKTTITRVKELAEMLDYEPNAFAVGLRKKSSNLYAIVVPEVGNFFYHDFLKAIEEEARMTGYSVLILQSMDDPEIELANLRICRHNNVAGIFVALSTLTRDFTPFERIIELNDIPVLFFDKVPEQNNFHQIILADEEGGETAAKLAFDSGATEVMALMGNQNLTITKRRLNGIRKVALQQDKVPVSYQFATSTEEAYTLTMNFLHTSKTLKPLIFAMSDEILCGVMQAIQTIGKKIPEDCKVIAMSAGFIPNLYHPTISYIETNGYALGKASFKAITTLSANQHTKPLQVSVPCQYVQGGSL